MPPFRWQKSQVLQLSSTQNFALTGKKQPKCSFFTYQNPKKEMELSKFIIFNKMGVFSSISIQTTLKPTCFCSIHSLYLNCTEVNWEGRFELFRKKIFCQHTNQSISFFYLQGKLQSLNKLLFFTTSS